MRMTLVLDDESTVTTVVAEVGDSFKLEYDLKALNAEAAAGVGFIGHAVIPRDMKLSAFMKGGHYYVSHVEKR